MWFLSQLSEGIQTGLFGLSVVSHVVMELNSVIDHAPMHRRLTMEHHAKDLLKSHRNVPPECAQHQVNVSRFLFTNQGNVKAFLENERHEDSSTYLTCIAMVKKMIILQSYPKQIKEINLYGSLRANLRYANIRINVTF